MRHLVLTRQQFEAGYKVFDRDLVDAVRTMQYEYVSTIPGGTGDSRHDKIVVRDPSEAIETAWSAQLRAKVSEAKEKEYVRVVVDAQEEE